MNRCLRLFACGLLVAFGVGGCLRAEPPPPQAFEGTQDPAENESTDAEAVIVVDGMSCQGCADAAAEVASRVPGCVSARGVFEDGTVVVRYRPDTITPEAIAAAITAADRDGAPEFSARLPSGGVNRGTAAASNSSSLPMDLGVSG